MTGSYQPRPASEDEALVERLARWIDPDAFEHRRRSSRNQHAANLSKSRARKLAKKALRFPPIKQALGTASNADAALKEMAE